MNHISRTTEIYEHQNCNSKDASSVPTGWIVVPVEKNDMQHKIHKWQDAGRISCSLSLMACWQMIDWHLQKNQSSRIIRHNSYYIICSSCHVAWQGYGYTFPIGHLPRFEDLQWWTLYGSPWSLLRRSEDAHPAGTGTSLQRSGCGWWWPLGILAASRKHRWRCWSMNHPSICIYHMYIYI